MVGLRIEQPDTAVEHGLPVSDARGELATAVGQSAVERLFAKTNELVGWQHELCERLADGLALTRAEQRLCGGIEKHDTQIATEHDDGGRQTLQHLVTARAGAAACETRDR